MISLNLYELVRLKLSNKTLLRRLKRRSHTSTPSFKALDRTIFYQMRRNAQNFLEHLSFLGIQQNSIGPTHLTPLTTTSANRSSTALAGLAIISLPLLEIAFSRVCRATYTSVTNQTYFPIRLAVFSNRGFQTCSVALCSSTLSMQKNTTAKKDNDTVAVYYWYRRLTNLVLIFSPVVND